MGMYHKGMPGSYPSRFLRATLHIHLRSMVSPVWQNFALCPETNRCGLCVPYARVQGIELYTPWMPSTAYFPPSW